MTDLLRRRADRAVECARRTTSTAAQAVERSRHTRQVLGLRRALSRGMPSRAVAGPGDQGFVIDDAAEAVLRRLLTLPPSTLPPSTLPPST